MVYVSIDIDFFNTRKNMELHKVLSIVKNSGKPVKIVDNHKHLYKDVNQSGCDTLINFDEHSDICDNSDTRVELNCGTWVNWVKKPLRNTYIWLHPQSDYEYTGYCHDRYLEECNPFTYPKVSGWKTCIRKRVAKGFPYELLYTASNFGIATSYAWLDSELEEKISEILKQYFGKYPPRTRYSYDDWR